MKILQVLKISNLTVAVLIAIVGIFMVLRPFLPDIVLAMEANKFNGYAYQSAETTKILGKEANELPQIPQDNRLVIPKIYVNTAISEGSDESALGYGMWHRPNTSTPDQGSNTVIAGHRVTYTSGPDTFYQLDKVNIHDSVLVYWQGKEYVYKVYEISKVNPDQIEIEFNTKDAIITLYSCTPLWTSEMRLVVKAKLQQ